MKRHEIIRGCALACCLFSTIGVCAEEDRERFLSRLSSKHDEVAINEELRRIKPSPELLTSLVADWQHANTGISHKACAVAIGYLGNSTADQHAFDELLGSDRLRFRTLAALRVNMLFDVSSPIPARLADKMRDVAKNNELVRSALCLRSSDAEEIETFALDLSSLVRATTARRVGSLIRINKLKRESGEKVLVRLLCDHDQLVRSAAVISAFEFDSCGSMQTVLEGLAIDLRESVSLEELFVADANLEQRNRYVPESFTDDLWIKTWFIRNIIFYSANSAPPERFVERIVPFERASIGRPAASVLIVNCRESSSEFIKKARQVDSVNIGRRKVFE